MSRTTISRYGGCGRSPVACVGNADGDTLLSLDVRARVVRSRSAFPLFLALSSTDLCRFLEALPRARNPTSTNTIRMATEPTTAPTTVTIVRVLVALSVDETTLFGAVVGGDVTGDAVSDSVGVASANDGDGGPDVGDMVSGANVKTTADVGRARAWLARTNRVTAKPLVPTT